MYTELIELSITANAGIKVNEEGYVVVSGLELGLDFSSIVIHLDNLLGGGDFGETINNLLSALGPLIWDAVSFKMTVAVYLLNVRSLMGNSKSDCANF